MLNVNVQSMRRELDEVSRRIALARGEHNALASRKTELETTVGLAKGRLDRKKDVERFIEELQADAHAKRVGDFEKLLSALVMEVLPGEKPIGLELEIERGQPSLDIVSKVAADLTEDIFEDQGGALTNIVVLGLRMIAVVRSGMRRFIVLDEPDCWIKDERVAAFYSVIKDAAKKIGMQCFAISHHNTSKFAEGISVARIFGHPENADGVHIENNPRQHRWSDDEEGFRYVRLVNFQGYIDETLHLHPGVNALIGDNNIGKSCFVRALRAVFYGDVRDRLIRRGQTSCSVEIGLREGYILQWTRHAKKNATWRLLAPNRAVFSDEYDTTSKGVPDWVIKDIGIGPIVGLDPHIIKQKTPIFLLDKPGSTRAAVLSIGQESSHIREMVRTYKKMCDEDSQTVRTGEAEMGRIMQREVHIAKALDHEHSIDELRQALDGLEKSIEETKKAEVLIEKIERGRRDNDRLRQSKTLLSTLPSQEDVIKLEKDVRNSAELANILERCERIAAANDLNKRKIAILGSLPREVPTIVPSDELIRFGKAVKDTLAANEAIRARIAILSQLPKEAPQLTDVSSAEKFLGDIERIAAEIAEKKRQRELAKKQADEIERQMNELVQEMGHSCPLCGGHVEDASSFIGGGHHHGQPQQAEVNHV